MQHLNDKNETSKLKRINRRIKVPNLEHFEASRVSIDTPTASGFRMEISINGKITEVRLIPLNRQQSPVDSLGMLQTVRLSKPAHSKALDRAASSGILKTNK